MSRQEGDKGKTEELNALAPEAALSAPTDDSGIEFADNEDLMQLPETVPSRFPEAALESSKEHISDLAVDLEDTEEDGKVMSVIDHLDELRQRLVRSLFVFGLAMLVSFYYGRQIIQILEIPGRGMHFQALSIEEPILVYFKVSFYAALGLAAPYLLYEVSSFIAPGLRKKERRVLTPIVIGGPILFASGAVFCYFLVLPPMLSFFNSFAGPIAPISQRLDYYISLVTTMIFYLGICFQLPIVLFALAIAGIINSRQLLSVWRYAIVASSVVAAIITPDPTVISMMIVMGALVGLYFFTVMLLKLFGK